MKIILITLEGRCCMILLPIAAPTKIPKASGTAIPGLIEPLKKYTEALAAAVTPIIKLLVALDGFRGIFIALSIAITLKAPEPIPNIPEAIPAPNMMDKPPGIFST